MKQNVKIVVAVVFVAIANMAEGSTEHTVLINA